METLLCLLAKDQAASKNKPIKEACTSAVELLENEEKVTNGSKAELREVCLTPLRLALDSRNSKLTGYAIDGLKKLVSEKRFLSKAQEEEYTDQMTGQVLNCLASCPNLPDDVMVALMKFMLNFFNSEAFNISEKSMHAVVELCLAVQKTNLLSGTRTAIRGALLQIISSICYQLHDKKTQCAASVQSQQNLKQMEVATEIPLCTGCNKTSDADNDEVSVSGDDGTFCAELGSANFIHQQQKGMNLLRHDVIETLKHLVSKIESFQESSNSSNALLNSQKLELCLDALLTGLRCLPASINCSPQFLEFVWQKLCPALIAILGNPRNLKTVSNTHEIGDNVSNISAASKMMSGHSYNAGSQEVGRGSGVSTSPPNMIGSNARNIYAIAGELLRLVGCLSSMRPVLQSLFHRILLFPPPNYRLEALRAVNEYFQSPMRVLDVCGPTIQDTARVNEVRSRREYDTDLLKLVMDGICESVYSCNSHVSSEAVGCIVSFLGTLAKISSGIGFQQYQIDEIISRWADNLELMSPDELSVKTKKFVRFSKELVQKRTFHTSNRADQSMFRQEFAGSNVDHDASYEEEIIAIDQIDRPNSNNSSGGGRVGGETKKQMEDEMYDDVDISDLSKQQTYATSESYSSRSRVSSTSSKHDSSESITLPPAPAIGCLKNDDEISLADEIRNSVIAHGAASMTVGTASTKSGAGEALATDFSHVLDSPDDEEDDAASEVDKSRDGSLAAAKVFDITDDPDQGLKLTKTLPDIESERQALERRVEVERLAQEKVEEERQCANDYVQHLISELPTFLRITDRVNVDRALLKFASDFCAEVADHQKEQSCNGASRARGRGAGMSLERSDSAGSNASSMLILNADGVYIATYYALLLNLKLIGSRYYENNGGRLPLTQKQFIEEIHDSGVLVYLSSTWLSELYKLIISCNILGEGGYSTHDPRVNNALILMLTDIDGMGNLELGGMMLHMSDKMNASLKKRIQKEHSQALNAGLKFSRRILLAVWDTILDVLAQPLRSKTPSGVTSIAMLIVEGTKEVTQRDREAICLSLEGLRNAAQLSCSLGVPSLCSSVFLLITNASCAVDIAHNSPSPNAVSHKGTSEQHTSGGKKSSDSVGSTGSSTPATPGLPLKLHASHVLSMEALLSVGLEIGSHCHDCWKFIFKCSAYIAQLERAYFSSGAVQNFSTFGKVKPVPSNLQATSEQNHSFDSEHGDFSFDISQQLSSSSAAEFSIVEIVSQARVEIGLERSNLVGGGILSPNNAARVVCGLSAEVDRLFEEAAVHLNLQALLQFLRELRFASQLQLFSKLASADDCGIAIPTMSSRSLPTSGKSCTALHLFRMGEIILKCIRTKRPILHVMRAWSIVAPHFVEASCHKDLEVSKKAVASIHNILTEILNHCPEHSHFNFHEALFKPFESMLRLELCDEDIQDQVICSICELVEACQENIKSGWRPLFGSLRAVRIQKHSNEENHVQISGKMDATISPVFDVFDAFLNTDNVYVFANAAIDCILCLLKFVKGSGDFDPFEDESVSDMDSTITETANNQSAELCLPALERLLYCSNILTSIYKMPLKPMFRGSRSVKLTSRLTLESRPTSGQDTTSREFGDKDGSCGGNQKNTQAVNVVYGVFMPSDLEQMDDETGKKYTGIVRVWYLLLEGLTGAVTTCPRQYQPQTLGLLFELLKAATEVPGPEFAVFAVTHLLLPMLHSWLRRGSCVRGFWETAVANFRHATGLSTDLVVEHINHFVKHDIPLTHVPLMLTQLVDLLVECVGQPNESVARLGCSCIKHLLVSAGPNFTEQMWTICCNGLKQAVNISMCFAKKLMEHFHPGSIDFNGDIGVVKVAARRDCSEMECERLQQLARQVFLLDSQYSNLASADTAGKLEPDMDETRSFIFIIYPPCHNEASTPSKHQNPSSQHPTPPDGSNHPSSTQSTLRVPFRNIVVGLVSHQLLLQTLGLLLLSGSKSDATETEQNLLPLEEASQISGSRSNSLADNNEQPHLPVFLDKLTKKQVNTLLECLLDSYKMAAEFDVRPGLKFLIQKVAKIDVAANLYRQVGASFTFYIHVLTELCIRDALKLPQNFVKATLKLEPLLNYLPSTSTQLDQSEQLSVSEATSDYSNANTPDLLSPNPSPASVPPPATQDAPPTLSMAPPSKSSSRSPQENRKDMMERLKRLQASSFAGEQPAPELSFAPCDSPDAGGDGEGDKGVEGVKGTGESGGCVGVSWGMEWIVKRMYAICAEVSATYVQMHLDKQGDLDLERISSQPLFLLIPDEATLQKSKKSSSFFSKDFVGREGNHHVIEEEEPLEIRAPNKKESMELGATHPQMQMSPPPPAHQVTGSGGDFYEDSTKMYTVATNKTIKNMMKEYKKRKVQHSRSVFVRKPFQEMKEPVYDPAKSADDNYQAMEIIQQEKSSIIKDSDAKIQAWTEMITGMIQLIQFPSDPLFKDLLPVTFPVINQLMCHVTNPLVRQAVFDYMNRISRIYNFV